MRIAPVKCYNKSIHSTNPSFSSKKSVTPKKIGKSALYVILGGVIVSSPFGYRFCRDTQRYGKKIDNIFETSLFEIADYSKDGKEAFKDYMETDLIVCRGYNADDPDSSVDAFEQVGVEYYDIVDNEKILRQTDYYYPNSEKLKLRVSYPNDKTQYKQFKYFDENGKFLWSVMSDYNADDEKESVYIKYPDGRMGYLERKNGEKRYFGWMYYRSGEAEKICMSFDDLLPSCDEFLDFDFEDDAMWSISSPLLQL